MKSRNRDKEEPIARSGPDVAGDRRLIEPDDILGMLERGEVVIEFESEEHGDTLH